MRLDGEFEFASGGAWLEFEPGVERVELEEVAMRLARRRTRAAIPDALEVVRTLARAVVEEWTLGVSSGSSVALAGMFQRSQWVQVPPGASGSSAISVSDCVREGAPSQVSSGERSAPSQVYLVGMTPPLGNEVDFKAKDMGRSPCISLAPSLTGTGALVGSGVPCRAHASESSRAAQVRSSNDCRRRGTV